ncbi:Hypothetical predicted protein [Marmota monax]|uniref:Ig kappa chain V-V region K2-like n=1 Tax=Marmota monax TaxID=9995 RepID=A0A5E4BY83_MARMO|nr:Ig kappa chain V-V region K2-like [Marmota monax]VTJ74598.1 Hypothetical predicted protein [Marmota monax]
MLWTYLFFYLSILCTGVCLDIILEPHTKTLTVLVGKPATFRCRVTGGDLKNYQMSWYKKNEDNSLFLIYKLNNSTGNLRNNLKGKIDTLKSEFILDIQKTTPQDAGTYYCGSDIHSATALFLITSRTLRVTPRCRVQLQNILGYILHHI